MPSRSKSVDSSPNVFSVRTVIPGFLKTARQQKAKEVINKTSSSFVRNHKGVYEGLKVSLSFGQGIATSVPWIAFTGHDQTVQNGIYPVYLYYKTREILVLAYGVSETNESRDYWPGRDELSTVGKFFSEKAEAPPERYGSSYVHSVYDTTKPLDFHQMENDLEALILEYHGAYVHDSNGRPSRRSKRTVFQYEFYSIEEALKELFIEERLLRAALNVLSYKKNIILKGPPGTGKTYLAKRLAYLQMGLKDNSRIQMIQFHQSYAYEDFIQGYRPNDKGGFELKNGVFYDFCQKARADVHNSYYFIIDEINRGNLGKIFGESMMLMENDKRGESFSIPLSYSRSIDEPFYIPSNVHIIGTMNTADRSLAMVDYALRRRFAFIDIEPSFGESFAQYLIDKGAAEILVRNIADKIKELNQVIGSDRNLGTGFKIGHSYFCGSTKVFDRAWYEGIIEYEIKPLLYEYWFDSEKKACDHLENLLS